jgi:hypothetical protein
LCSCAILRIHLSDFTDIQTSSRIELQER